MSYREDIPLEIQGSRPYYAYDVAFEIVIPHEGGGAQVEGRKCCVLARDAEEAGFHVREGWGSELPDSSFIVIKTAIPARSIGLIPPDFMDDAEELGKLHPEDAPSPMKASESVLQMDRGDGWQSVTEVEGLGEEVESPAFDAEFLDEHDDDQQGEEDEEQT